MGAGSGVTLSSILRVKETFLENVDKSGIHRGNRVYARKIHFEDGQFVFYLTAEDAVDCAPPWALGMDATIYKRLQKTACSMFGLRIR